MKKLLGSLCLLLVLALPAFAFWPFSSSDTPYVTKENSTERVIEDIVRKEWSVNADWDKDPARVREIALYKQVQGGIAAHIVFRMDSKFTDSGTKDAFAEGASRVIAAMVESEKLKEITEFRLFGCAEKAGYNVVKLNISRDLASKVKKGMSLFELQQLAMPGTFWTALN